jgi:phosphoglycerate-specific signal transduction histidine kinase
LAIILYRNNKQKQKANSVLTDQKKKVENTLEELQKTQKQLIQSEKMASLGRTHSRHRARDSKPPKLRQ